MILISIWQHSFGDLIRMAAKQREEKVGRNARTPQPEQAIQPKAKGSLQFNL